MSGIWIILILILHFRGLPFDAVLPETNKREDFRAAFNALREEASDKPEMTLEEINAEISATRADRKRG